MQVGTAAGSLRLLCGQFRPGHRHDLRNGRSSCFHGRPSWNRICPFWFSWGCILAAILCALRPWLQEQAHGAQEIQHARTLLNLYSQNPCSYLALEDDKCLYFGHSVDGVLPYGTVGDTIVVNGDPVCKDEDFPALLAEFREFCQNSAHNIFFLGLTDYYLSEYEKQGFGLVKSGEEARFSFLTMRSAARRAPRCA